MNQLDDFPIPSQTTHGDKVALLKLRDIARQKGHYSYLEIGSYLGGSLTPFLRDPQCSKVLSIDDRHKDLPDERGSKFNYAGIGSDQMISTLKSANVDTEKLEVFDGSVDDLPPQEEKFDFLFIDGEHTDRACARDFLFARRLASYNSIVAFHDSSIIYRALVIINEIMRSERRNYKFYKDRESDVSFILMDDWSSLDMSGIFNYELDVQEFYAVAETFVLEQVLKNRVKLQVMPMPSHRAY